MENDINLHDKLPYELTKGATATWEGLEISDAKIAGLFLGFRVQQHRADLDGWEPVFGSLFGIVDNDVPMHILIEEENCIYEADAIRISWPDVAKYLLYQEGKPWLLWTGLQYWTPMSTHSKPSDPRVFAFYRIVAILCNDDAALRILHACIEEFGNGNYRS